MPIIDVWMQHPTLRFAQHDMFESLRRWTGQSWLTTDIPIEVTVAAMDEAGVDRGLMCAWYGPDRPADQQRRGCRTRQPVSRAAPRDRLGRSMSPRS